jgi:hypothetical protein
MMDDKQMPRKLLASWVNNPWKVGWPQLCYHQTFARTINSIVDSDYNGTFKLLIPQATTHEWTQQIANWCSATNWCSADYPAANLDLVANWDLPANLNYTQPFFSSSQDW